MSIKNKFPNIKPSLNLDFANTKRLDPRITFTRASTATYWDGVTQAKAEENLLKYSQDFENAAWVNAEVTITANAVTAPDGTTTADTLTGNGVSGLHSILQTATTSTVGKAFSVYLKAGTNNFAQIFFDGDAAPFADFDLSTGTVGTTGGSVTATATAAGNGWYRCAVYTASTTATNPRVCLVSSSTAVRAESNSLSTAIYMWGAQLEQRSQATAYTPTTDQPITKHQPVLQTAASGVPRFDHNPVTGESLGLLIEEQRTNLLTYSGQFDNAAWTKTDATVYPNATVAPDGTLSGDLIVYTTASSAHPTFQNTALTSGIAYTQTVYVKSAGQAFFNIYGSTGFNSGGFVTFNLSTGTVSNSNLFTGAISSVGNGWYKCSVTASATSTVSGRLVMRGLPSEPGSSGSGNLYTGDGYSGIYIWGAQLEAGAFPTSYIPTTSEQVTRAADAASMTGTNFSSWYRQDEGTLFGDAVDPVLPAVSRAIVEVNDGTDANRFNIQSKSQDDNTVGFVGVSKSSIVINLQAAGLGDGRVKAAFALGPILSGGAIGCADGNLAPSIVDPIIPMPLSSLRIGATSIGAAVWNGTIKKIAYYPKRLTNAELQALTT